MAVKTSKATLSGGKKATTLKGSTKTPRQKSEAIRKEYPNFNVVSRGQQSRKVDKVTGNVKAEYAMTPGERRNHENYLKRKGLKK